MGKILTLLRHGEAEPAKGQQADFKRNLTTDGAHRLERLSQVLSLRNLHYDLLLSSTSNRTVQTSEIIQQGLPCREAVFFDTLYLADVQVMMELISQQKEENEQVLLVGHNPGISALLSYISGEHQLTLQPGMMAMVEIEADSWALATSRGLGILREVLQ